VRLDPDAVTEPVREAVPVASSLDDRSRGNVHARGCVVGLHGPRSSSLRVEDNLPNVLLFSPSRVP